MKQTARNQIVIGLISVALILPVLLRAANEPAQRPTPPLLSSNSIVEELRQQLPRMSPAEREAKLKELRQKFEKRVPDREPWDKRREELKSLTTPEERKAKVREWRSLSSNAPMTHGLSPEEIQARREVFKTRLQERIREFRTNKAAGTLNAEDQVTLKRMEEVAKHFERTGSTPGSRPTTSLPAAEKVPGGSPEKTPPGK